MIIEPCELRVSYCMVCACVREDNPFVDYLELFPYIRINHTVTSLLHRECSGSVVECLTRDRGGAGSSLNGVTALCP